MTALIQNNSAKNRIGVNFMIDKLTNTLACLDSSYVCIEVTFVNQ